MDETARSRGTTLKEVWDRWGLNPRGIAGQGAGVLEVDVATATDLDEGFMLLAKVSLNIEEAWEGGEVEELLGREGVTVSREGVELERGLVTEAVDRLGGRDAVMDAVVDMAVARGGRPASGGTVLATTLSVLLAEVAGVARVQGSPWSLVRVPEVLLGLRDARADQHVEDDERDPEVLETALVLCNGGMDLASALESARALER